MNYSGGRRRLVLLIDRATATALDLAAAEADLTPEATAVAHLRRALVDSPTVGRGEDPQPP